MSHNNVVHNSVQQPTVSQSTAVLTVSVKFINLNQTQVLNSQVAQTPLPIAGCRHIALYIYTYIPPSLVTVKVREWKQLIADCSKIGGAVTEFGVDVKIKI